MIDVLSSPTYDRAYGNRKHLGIIMLLRLLFLRCFLLTATICIALNYTLNHFKVNDLAVGIVVGFVAVFIEEQARWIFTKYSNRVVLSAIEFSVVAIIIESIGFYKHGTPFYTYLAVRLGPILVHTLNGALCAISFGLTSRSKMILFAIAVAFHLFMNVIGWVLLAGLLLR